MAENLTFRLTGRDDLSRVLNGTADSADRLRLRLAGITADSDGQLRDLQGRYVSVADAQRRLAGETDNTRHSFAGVRDEAGKLGEAIKANLISLAPAAIPAAAGLASSAAAVAGQFGAVAVAAGVYALALGPQIGAITDAVAAQDKYQEAVRDSGATSEEAVKAQQAYQKQLDAMPPATREAAVAVGLLKDNYKAWSDSLAGDVMGPFNKGVAIANTLLPKTTGLVKGASGQFDRLITLAGGAISTPGFDRLTGKVSDFADHTLDHAVDELTVFLAKAQGGDLDNSEVSKWMDYAKVNGPLVTDTLENVGEALLHVLEAGSGVGVSMLDVINGLSGIVAALPPEAISTLLQLAIAIKAAKLAAAGADVLGAVGRQIALARTAAAGTSGALNGVSAAITGMSRSAKIAVAGTGLGLLLIAMTEIKSRSKDTAPDVDQLTSSIGELGRTGKVTGELAATFGSDLSELGHDLDQVSKSNGVIEFFDDLSSGFGLFAKGDIAKAKDEIDTFDKGLANLVGNGNAKLAAAALNDTIQKLHLNGDAADELRDQLGDYNDALAGQALEQRLAAESMGMFGNQAQQVQAQLEAQKSSADGLRQSIQALNDVNRQGLSGMIGFEAAVDAASKAAQENAGVLDMQGGRLTLNTEKQRNAAQALNDLAAKTDEATASARESGASWSEVSGIYERGRAAFIRSAQAMGLTRSQAKQLADQILKTPNKTAYLRGDIKDLRAKLADAERRLRNAPSSKTAKIKGQIDDLKNKLSEAQRRINGVHGKTVLLNVDATFSRNAAKYAGYADGGLIRRASGGPIPGFPGGGPVLGPGTSTSDDVLLWGSNGEYMVKAASVARYGLAFMDALNDGRLPVGRTAPSPGAAAAAPSVRSSVGAGPAVTYNVYPRASVISVQDLRLIQRQEEARQRVGRAR